jgi:hypothetical protein
MRRMEVVQGLRRMKFDDLHGRWQQRQLSEAAAAEISGIGERSLAAGGGAAVRRASRGCSTGSSARCRPGLGRR